MPDPITDRIKELRRVPAATLIHNSKNWRRHPRQQREGMQAMLENIGYADALIARESPEGLVLLDGHLRAEVTPDAIVPVLVVDLSEREADQLLATFDSLGALAEPDASKLQELLATIDAGDNVKVLLEDISDRYSVGLTQLLEQPTEAAYAPLPEMWNSQNVKPGTTVDAPTHIDTSPFKKDTPKADQLKPFMFYIEQDKHNGLMEALFRLGSAWGLETLADVVFEAVRRADSGIS